jgi:hypothetical protein
LASINQAAAKSGARVVARRSSASASLIPFLAHEDAGQAAQRVDVVRVLAQRAAQGVDRLTLAIGPQVIHCERDLALAWRLLEKFLEGRIGLATSAEQRQRLPELLLHKRQARLELDRPLEARDRFGVPVLQREHTPEILVQMREFGHQGQCETHGLLSLGIPRLLGERMTEQPQMLGGAGAAVEIVAADLLGAQRSVHPQRLECGLYAVFPSLRQRRYFRYLSNHSRTRRR